MDLQPSTRWLRDAIRPALMCMYKNSIPTELDKILEALHIDAPNAIPQIVTPMSTQPHALEHITPSWICSNYEFRWFLLLTFELAFDDYGVLHHVQRATLPDDHRGALAAVDATPMSDEDALKRLNALGVDIGAVSAFSEGDGTFANMPMRQFRNRWLRERPGRKPCWADILTTPFDMRLHDGIMRVRSPHRWEVYSAQRVSRASLRALYIVFWASTRYPRGREETSMRDEYARADRSRMGGMVMLPQSAWKA